MDALHYARVKFYDLLLSNFAGEYGETLQIKNENQTFEQPVDEDFLATYMINRQSRRSSIGTTKKFQTHCGFFCIECQVPAGTGVGNMWLMSSAVARCLEEMMTTLDDGSYLSTGTAVTVGNTAQDQNYFVTVMVPFDIQECKPAS